jgi:predicted MFS family arabinose efflux permease
MGCFLASKADAVWQLILVLGICFGISSACLGMAGQTPLIKRWFPGRTGTAIGIIGSATGLGTLVFAPLAELLIQASGWRYAYETFALLAGALALVALVLPWRRLEAGLSGTENVRGLGGGLRLTEVMNDPVFWGIFAAYFVTAAGSIMLQPQLAAYFVHVGYQPLAAATWIGVGGIAGFVGMILFGWLGDRLGLPTAILLSYVLTVVGVLTLAAMMWVPALWLMPIYVVTFALSFGSRGPMVMSLAANRWAGGVLGRVTGILLAAIGFGGGMGAWLGGYLQDASGYEAVFAASGTALALGALAWWLVLRALAPSQAQFTARSADSASAE